MTWEGFRYNDLDHAYYLNDVEMTGVTSVLDGIGSPGGLQQYAANHSAAYALRQPVPDGFKEALDEAIEKHGKLSTPAARELDRFKDFKAARTAHLRNTKKAANRGTDNHSLCERFELGETVLHTVASQKYADWYTENVEKTWFVERPMFSVEWFMGGTPDGGFRTKDGKNLINDKKFKDSIYDNKPHWQMAAYRKMYEEMSGDTSTPVRIEWKDSVEEYANPREYLQSFADVTWDGSVVLCINEQGVFPEYRYAYEEDRKSFESALWCYRHISK